MWTHRWSSLATRDITTLWCSVALLSLCSACATKPPPSATEIRQQAMSRVNVDHPWKAAAADGNAVHDDWLSSFRDAELDALVREAIAYNPDLQVAAARVTQAQQYLATAQAALRPWLSLAGTGGTKSGGGDASSALQGLVLGASWELDLWGRLRYARNAAEQSYESVRADFEFAKQSIAAATAKAWFTATQLSLHAELAADMVQASQQLQMLAEQRQRVGVGTETETAQARAALSNMQDEQQQIAFARGQALRALELLVGRYPAAEIIARGQLVTLPGPMPVGVPLQMLDRRPDVIAAERRVAAAFNRVGEAKAAYFPKITLTANIATFSSEVLQLKQDYDNPTYGIGARMIAPLYQGGALKAQVQIRTAEQKEAVADYGRIALRALNDVENALAANESLAARVSYLNTAFNEQTRALKFTEDNVRVGRVDQRSIQQQRITLNDAKVVLLNARTDQLAAWVNLYLALGGGFAPAEQSADTKQ